MAVIETVLRMILSTAADVLPIVLFIFGFQALVIRKPLPHLGRLVSGLVFVIIGLGLFLIGLETALFPLGESMAVQLTAPEQLLGADAGSGAARDWTAYVWVYVFAAAIGFSAAIAEPALLAVSMKAHDVSGGAISVWGLRVAVAIGAGTGVALGCYRIVTGLPLPMFFIVGYVIVILQTIWAPKLIVPLAYDSGGVTTSTVTVPLIAALGLGLAEAIPGRSPLLDGFGLVAITALFPIITVLSYAQLSGMASRRRKRRQVLARQQKQNETAEET